MQQFRILVFLACLVQPVLGFAHSYDCGCSQDPVWWMNIGVGTGVTTSSECACHETQSASAAQFSFNYSLTPHTFFTIYSHAMVDFSKDYCLDTLQDGGLMLGVINRGPQGYCSLSTGVAYVEAKREFILNGWDCCGPYAVSMEYDTRHGIGVPVQAQLFWTPYQHIGFGLIAHALVVPEPTGSLMFAIQLSA